MVGEGGGVLVGGGSLCKAQCLVKTTMGAP